MKRGARPFIAFESLIYVLFIFLDMKGLDSSWVKYTGMLACLVYCLINGNIYLKIAMTFTLIADLFLLIINDHYLTGVLSFVIVQITYCLYLRKSGSKIYLPARAGLFLVCLAVLYLTDSLEPLYIAASFYFLNLVMNFVSSLSGNTSRLYSIGLLLFILCDICVGLHNILSPGQYYDIVTFLMWVFYLPSQVLISVHNLK